MNKRGEILVENVIFIVLNLLFLSILVLFLMRQGSGEVIMEEAYSKQLALLADSARPGEVLQLNMEDAMELADGNGFSFDKVVSFENNMATVKFSSKGGYSYHYFNDVQLSAFPNKVEGEYSGIYTITVVGK